MERITIYPKKELKAKLEKEAKKQSRSLNNLIILILNKSLKNKNAI